MRVIRPVALTGIERRRALLLAGSMLAAGTLACLLAIVTPGGPMATGSLAATAAIGLGVGCAWLARVLRPSRGHDLSVALVDLLGPAFDDSYTLLVAPRLPVRDAVRLDGILVGPAGVRVLTARDWHGRYRVRGRTWEFDARGGRWIACRTNPSFDASALAEGVERWASSVGLDRLPLKPAIAFPHRRSRVVLEEPADEIVSRDNAPWWANQIGRVQRLDPALAARLVTAILDAAEAPVSSRSGPGRRPKRV